MSLDVNALRSFLVAAPKPAKILVTCGDGEQKEVVPPKGHGGVTWAGVARSIETLDPSTVELFDLEDKLLRAQRFDASARSDVAAPDLPAILARDAESARLMTFAQLLAGAYRFSVEVSFTKLVELFERLDRRQEVLESRLERSETNYRKFMQDRIDEALEEAERAAQEAQQSQDNPLAKMAQSFIGGVAQAQQAPPNGKGK